MNLESRSDEELVALCKTRRDGDDRPFAELFRRHHRFVWSICRRMLRRGELADELAQDVFVRAFRSIGRFDGRSKLTTWLYRICGL